MSEECTPPIADIAAEAVGRPDPGFHEDEPGCRPPPLETFTVLGTLRFAPLEPPPPTRDDE